MSTVTYEGAWFQGLAPLPLTCDACGDELGIHEWVTARVADTVVIRCDRSEEEPGR